MPSPLPKSQQCRIQINELLSRQAGTHHLRRIHLDPSESHTTFSLADVSLSDGMRVGRKWKGILGRYERVGCLVDIPGPFLGAWKQREDVQSIRRARRPDASMQEDWGCEKSCARSVLSLMEAIILTLKARFFYLRFVVGRNKMSTFSVVGRWITICRSEPEAVIHVLRTLSY